MRTGIRRITLAAALAAGAALLLDAVSAPACLAGETGTLKLKVRSCMGMIWLSNAEVDVVIYRPGSGQIDSATGYTSSSGYVEFTFDNLQQADQARVTVTPSGGGPADSGHTYYWIASSLLSPGQWDVGPDSDSICQDDWYDEGQNIIECVYR